MKVSDIIAFAPYGTTVNKAVEATKNLLGENVPYRVEELADGTSKVHLEPHFLVTVGEALDNNIISGMGKEEKSFWFEYVDYAKDMADGVRNELVQDIGVIQTPIEIRELALKTLAEWIASRGA